MKESIFKAFLKNVFENQQWEKYEKVNPSSTTIYLQLNDLLIGSKLLLKDDFSSLISESPSILQEVSEHETVQPKKI